MFKGVGVPLNIKELYGDLVNRTCEDGLRYPDSTCEALFIVREAEYSGENQVLPLLNIELQCIWSEDTFSVKPGHYLSESFMKMMELGVVDTTQKETTILKEDPLLTSVLTAGGFTIDDIGQSAQLIVVQSSGTSCAINLLEKNMQTGTWVVAYQTTGVVGKNGVSVNAQEGSMYTPRGAFPLDILAFGTHTQAEIDNINRFIKYQQITENSYWCDGVESPQYNQWVETANPDWSTKSEHLIEYQSSYEYAVFIGYNYNPVVAGKGSAFFLHVSSASYTAGCVGTSQASMQAIFSWLNFLKAPKILIF
jgi:L,D-peptidoglycan transpeptidase YkuD (ErfK/YbiS/YcfS/YnhG family)